MKRIIRLTESDLARIVRRVILENDEKTTQLINSLHDLLQGKTMNFYLPEDNSDPIINQFEADDIQVSEDLNTVTLIGKGKKPGGDYYNGKIKLKYTCNSKNTFSVEIDRFNENFKDLNTIYKAVDQGVPDTWKVFLRSFANFKFENDYSMDTSGKRQFYIKLVRKYRRPFVEGGTSGVGKQMIRMITDEMCSYNIKGNAVPKADMASLGTGINNNLG